MVNQVEVHPYLTQEVRTSTINIASKDSHHSMWKQSIQLGIKLSSISLLAVSTRLIFPDALLRVYALDFLSFLSFDSACSLSIDFVCF